MLQEKLRPSRTAFCQSCRANCSGKSHRHQEGTSPQVWSGAECSTLRHSGSPGHWPTSAPRPARAHFPLRDLWEMVRAELASSPLPAQPLPEAVLTIHGSHNTALQQRAGQVLQSRVSLQINHDCQSNTGIQTHRHWGVTWQNYSQKFPFLCQRPISLNM